MSRIAIAQSQNIETVLRTKMQDVTAQRVGTVKKQVESAVASRLDYEARPENLFNGAVSKDTANLKKLNHENVFRFFAAIGLNPEYYINSVQYDAATFESKSKVPSECKTGSLKAYKKFAETAHYFANGSKLEAVLMTFVACSIISAQFNEVIPRDVCEKFLGSVPLNHVSEELNEALDTYRAKHMTGGASTQTSQCTLQLCNMFAANVVRNGRSKDFVLNVHSPVVESFAQRFNLVPQLERAQSYRASLEAQRAEMVSAD
jgi:hypothetical protein